MDLVKLNLHGLVSEAFVKAVDNRVHIICLPQNEGTCPSADPFNTITAFQASISADIGGLGQRQWFVHKGDGVSEFKFRLSAIGHVSAMYIGNKLLRHFPLKSEVKANDIEREDICRYANMSPITVYPAPCALSENGYLYWSYPYSHDGLTNQDVVWADSQKFLEEWKKSTKRGGIPHIEPDLASAKEYGSYILRTSYDQPFEMAHVSFNKLRTSFFERSHFLSFTNGRHRVSNAIAFGCDAIPVITEEINGREKLRAKVGNKHILQVRDFFSAFRGDY